MSERQPEGCNRPIRVRRGSGLVRVACGSRITARCAYCAALFRNDWKAIGRDGIINAPEGSVLYFVTLTAPSFGDVHKVPDEGAPPRRCPCGVVHTFRSDAHLRGVAINTHRYDYHRQVAWNYHSGALWSNTARVLRRHMPSAEYFGGWEFQERGARHIHLILRVHSDHMLRDVEILELIRGVSTRSNEARPILWGSDLHIKRLTSASGLPAHAFRENRRARILNYLLKAVGYTVKDTDTDPSWTSPEVDSHFRNLDRAARELVCDKCQPGKRCSSLVHSRWGARRRIVVNSRASAATGRPGWSPRQITRTKQSESRRNYRRLKDLQSLQLYRPHRDVDRFRRHLLEVRS